METLSRAIEYYNLTVIQCFTDVQSIDDLKKKAESKTLEYLRSSLQTKSNEQQECIEENLKRLIASNLSVWKPLAIDLVNGKEELQKLHDNSENVKRSFTYVERSRDDYKSQVILALDQIDQLNRSLQANQGELEIFDTKNRQISAQKRTCENENKNLRAELDQANFKISSLKSDLKKMEKSLDKLKNTNLSFKDEMEKLEYTILESNESNAQLKAEKLSIEDQFKKTRNDFDELTSKHQKLIDDNKRLLDLTDVSSVQVEAPQ